MVGRIVFPILNGRHKSWSKFTRTLKELIRASQLSPVLELPMLKAKITEEASNMINGITDPAEARGRLNARYGDEQLAAIAAMKELIEVRVPAG